MEWKCVGKGIRATYTLGSGAVWFSKPIGEWIIQDKRVLRGFKTREEAQRELERRLTVEAEVGDRTNSIYKLGGVTSQQAR